MSARDSQRYGIPRSSPDREFMALHMGLPFIVLGDQTDHGGVVIEASGVTDTHGKGIARVGDKVSCPKRGHSGSVIVEGDNTMIIDGRAAAYHGCKTSCGAILVASQFVSSIAFGGGGGRGSSSGTINAGSSGQAQASTGQAAAVDSGVASAAAAKSSGKSNDATQGSHDQHFLLLNNQTGQPLEHVRYRISLADGRAVEGVSDAQGKTEKVFADSALGVKIEVLL